MQNTPISSWAAPARVIGSFVFCALFVAFAGSGAQANVPLTQISADPFTNPAAAHATEVESDNFAFGNTMVGVFQQGRFQDQNAGSTDIGWSTSFDGGSTWQHGSLPGISGPGMGLTQYSRSTDPAVAYDAKHGVWMVVSLPRGIAHRQLTYLVPIVSRSSDGLNWQRPVHIAPDSGHFMDKPWIACDNASSSTFYGNCYVEYIDVNIGEELLMSTSSDGGAHWSTPAPSADRASGNGGQPVVQPNGTVVIPFLGFGQQSVRSTDGGKTWQASVLIANANEHPLAGGIRDPGPLPSAEVDANGIVYVAWWDCSFRTNCSANDIVFSTSSDGQHWSSVSRIPIDSLSKPRDHFLPGIGVDHSTGGSGAHVGVTYYYLANANCTQATCQIYAGFIGSTNGGASWNSSVRIAGPMSVTWLPGSDLGHMIGDYMSTSFSEGLARSTMPIAFAPSGGMFNQAVYTTANGFAMEREALQRSSRGDHRYPMPRVRYFRWIDD